MLTLLSLSFSVTESSSWVTLLGTFFFSLIVSRGWWQWPACINIKDFKLYFWAGIKEKQMSGKHCCHWMMKRSLLQRADFIYGCFLCWFLQKCPLQVFHHSSTLSAKKPEAFGELSHVSVYAVSPLLPPSWPAHVWH